MCEVRRHEAATSTGVVAKANGAAAPGATGGVPVCAELAGQIRRVLVSEGDSVAEGDVLLILEALKMEIEVKAPSAGVVSRVAVVGDQSVQSGELLVALSQ